MPPLKLSSEETFGQRLARFRKERGMTQQALADRVGIIQVLVADYERDKLRLNAEMICRIAIALGISADELLGLKKLAGSAKPGGLSLRVIRRMRGIESLSLGKQKALFQTIDAFLSSEGISASGSKRGHSAA